MSILVKGMKMPKDKPIRIVLNPNGQLFIDHGVHFTEYEAVELPPHGRLIDADVLIERYKPDMNRQIYGGNFIFDIENMPTIIESEDGT